MRVNGETGTALEAEIAALRQRVAELEQSAPQSQASETYTPFFTQALDMLAIAGFDGYFKQLNPIWERVLGFTQAELLAKPFIDFVHPDDRAATIAEAQQLALTEIDTIGFENRYIAKDGSYRWLRWKATADAMSGLIYCTTRDITEEKEIAERLQVYAEVVKNMPVGLCVYRLEDLADNRSLRLMTANPAADRAVGAAMAPYIGMLMYEMAPSLYDTEVPETYANIIRSGKAMTLGEVQFSDEKMGESFFQIQAFPLPSASVGIIFENITESKRSHEAFQQAMAQEETIRAQEAAMAEMTTPLLTISDDTVIMPLIGTIDSRRAQQVMEALLNGVAQSRAQIAILDITGVSVVDTQVANALIRAAQAVQLLGARVVLTGIRPEVAQTLVGLGVDLGSIVTRSTLQSGIAYAMR